MAAGLLLACSLAAQEEVPTTVTPTTEKQTAILLLANVWNPSIDPTGWWMSEKYDGLRGYWDCRKLWSRQGNLIHAPDYFLAELPRDIALDGELWIGYGKFEETVSIVRSETPDDRWKRVQFMVFDAPQAKGTFEQRMYADNLVFIAEDRLITDTVAKFNWDPKGRSISSMRDRLVTHGTRAKIRGTEINSWLR